MNAAARFAAFEKRIFGRGYKPDPTLLLAELSPQQRQRLVTEFGLPAYGQPRVLGKGTKAVAFASDRPDIVIKLTTDPDDAYASTKIMVKGEQFSDVLARVYFVAQVNEFVWVVISERLQPIFNDKLLSDLSHDQVYNEYAWKHEGRTDTPVLAALTRLYQAEVALGLKLTLDAHPGNWGLRGDKLVYFDFGSTVPAEKPMIKKLNPSNASIHEGEAVSKRFTPKLKKAIAKKFKIDFKKDLVACGASACAWRPGLGKKKPADHIVKITRDPADAFAAELISRNAVFMGFTDILARIHGVWQIEGAVSWNGEPYYVIVSEYVKPVMATEPGVANDSQELVRAIGWAQDMIAYGNAGVTPPDPEISQGVWSYVTARMYRLKDVGNKLGLDLIGDAHAGNWGLRDKNDLGTLVLFDYGRSGARRAILPIIKGNPPLTPAKAATILHDGYYHDRAGVKRWLTENQRRYFGMIASGKQRMKRNRG